MHTCTVIGATSLDNEELTAIYHQLHEFNEVQVLYCKLEKACTKIRTAVLTSLWTDSRQKGLFSRRVHANQVVDLYFVLARMDDTADKTTNTAQIPCKALMIYHQTMLQMIAIRRQRWIKTILTDTSGCQQTFLAQNKERWEPTTVGFHKKRAKQEVYDAHVNRILL